VDDEVVRLYQILRDIPTEIIADTVHARRMVKDHRGNVYFDWGISGSRSCGRQDHYGSGCSFPRDRSIVPELDDYEGAVVLDSLEKLSIIFTDADFQHLIPSDEIKLGEYFNHPKGTRQSFRKVLKLDEKFGNNKYDGIIFPRARFHYTGCGHVVLPHCDWENAENSLSSFVASFCRYVKFPSVDGLTTTIRRTGFHGYGCQALENCQQCYNKLQPFIVLVSKFYNKLEEHPRVVNKQLFIKQTNRQWHHSTPHVSKIVGLSCFADCIIRFSHRIKSKISIRTYLGFCYNTLACESPDYYVEFLDQLVVHDDGSDMMAWSMYEDISVSKSTSNNNNNINNKPAEKRQMHQPTHNKKISHQQYNENVNVLLQVVQYYMFQEVPEEY
jgi:hypothetical protein